MHHVVMYCVLSGYGGLLLGVFLNGLLTMAKFPGQNNRGGGRLGDRFGRVP